MFKSYWTMAWRSLIRNRIYSLVNVLGLALGICACLVIWVIVRYEFGFDRNHADGSRIYRLNSYEQFMKDEPERFLPYVSVDLPEAIRKEVPGVETVAPFHILDHDTAMVVGTGKQKTGYPAMPIADGPEYFRIMTSGRNIRTFPIPTLFLCRRSIIVSCCKAWGSICRRSIKVRPCRPCS